MRLTTLLALLALTAGLMTWAVLPDRSYPACLDQAEWVVAADLFGSRETIVLRDGKGRRCQVTRKELNAYLDARGVRWNDAESLDEGR